MTRRSLQRAFAWFLVLEDPQRRLEAQPVVTLAHQASLVNHVLQEPNLRRVLIADEVGLGKTVEAALIVKDLISRAPALRVLYLAPARLVSNVRREFERLELGFRTWVSGDERDGRLSDSRLLASIHRAAHQAHFESVANSGPWDVVIVDECHHLSDWQPNGGKPTQKYRLVSALQEKLAPEHRLILLSGTPHQGHAARFENLLRLLRRSEEPEEAIAGRVIYRTKEHVADWDGRPLFPRRQVNAPLVIDLGSTHREWLASIHHFFEPDKGVPMGQARQRAVGWRCGQALQWATSSIEAGIGFLCRQAIRAGWSSERPQLAAALLSLRPYRGGSLEESASALCERMKRDIKDQVELSTIEDLESEEAWAEMGRWRPDEQALASLLSDGVSLLRASGNAKWDVLDKEIVRGARGEKIVFFAQPLETVTALSRYLESRYGRAPAQIYGGQSEEQRTAAIEAFWREDGPQFLVSSRAGGEGLNLQIARRLVHVDVPWNPMEMEQRVGRVHRFLSKRTIIVDTLVVQESREVHIYRAAREKLKQISSTVVPEDEFEQLFARVMSLVPPEEFTEVFGERPLGPLNTEETKRVADLVSEGFASWKQFHEKYSDQRKTIRALDPGQARWSDLSTFARDHLQAKPATGFSALRFRLEEGEVVEDAETAEVLQVDNRYFASGDYGGSPVSGSGGKRAESLGLNVDVVCAALRGAAFAESDVGAAHVRWPEAKPLPLEGLVRPFGVLLVARTSLVALSNYEERSTELHAAIVHESGETVELSPGLRAEVVRSLLQGVVRREPEDHPELVEALCAAEEAMIARLRRRTDEDSDQRVVHACTPLLAALVS